MTGNRLDSFATAPLTGDSDGGRGRGEGGQGSGPDTDLGPLVTQSRVTHGQPPFTDDDQLPYVARTEPGGSSRGPWPTWITALAISGALLLLAGALMTLVGSDPMEESSPRHLPSHLSLSGPTDVEAGLVTYQPGQESTWHTHTGLHAAVVVSGTLTVYDTGCRPKRYEVGDAYVGGREVHLARNETSRPLKMAVTTMFAADLPHGDFMRRAAKPSSCDLGR